MIKLLRRSLIIFAKTRWEYQSYQDYWELVELSNFKIIFTDQIDWDSDEVYILSPLNGEVPNPLPERKCKVIWLNIERPTEGYKMPRDDFDEIWVCDKKWADKSGARFFFMASDERLGHSGTHSEPPVTLAYVNGRRAEKYQAMGCNNQNNTFGQTKKDLLANSKALVVLHQDVPVLSPQRFCYAAAAHLSVFYEEVPDFYPFEPYKDFIPITFNDCVDVVHKYVDLNSGIKYTDENENVTFYPYNQVGEKLYQLLCVKTNFRKEVERMFE